MRKVIYVMMMIRKVSINDDGSSNNLVSSIREDKGGRYW